MPGGICLSMEDVGLTLIERRNSGIRDKSYADIISAKYHLRPDIAQAYVDAVIASGAVGAKCMDKSKFVEYMHLCRMFAERYMEFYDSVFMLVKDESARKQLSVNCPMLLRICDSIVKSYWLSLPEVLGMTLLPDAYCHWMAPKEISSTVANVSLTKQSLKNVVVPENKPVDGKELSKVKFKRSNILFQPPLWKVDTSRYKPAKLDWKLLVHTIIELCVILFGLACRESIFSLVENIVFRCVYVVLLIGLTIHFGFAILACLIILFKWLFQGIRYVFYLGSQYIQLFLHRLFRRY